MAVQGQKKLAWLCDRVGIDETANIFAQFDDYSEKK